MTISVLAIHWLYGLVAAAAVGVALIVYRLIKRWKMLWGAAPRDNGIWVGVPKTYDNRSLSLMLEQLREQLRAVQTIDSGTLTASTGTQQGERSRDLGGSLDIGLSPAPAKPAASASTKGKKEAGEGDSGDSSSTPAGAGEKTGTQKQGSPQPTWKWSERGSDLLADQVNLSYQIFNLQLVLERALSDRLSRAGTTRLQAVIGIPISIDPPPFAYGCTATVDVRFSSTVGSPSLVALFPQEQTYNTWGIDHLHFQVGVKASAGGASVGAKGQSQASDSYFLRQADIVAFERPPSVARALEVTWQFRPGFGQKTVSAGLRQVLAVLALEDADDGVTSARVEVEVRTSWQAWSPRSQTAANWRGWRAATTDQPTMREWRKAGDANVLTSESLENQLKPEIDDIQWLRVGQNTAAVVVSGRNFFNGTSVVMGDEVLDRPDKGLIIKSTRSLQITAPISALLSDTLLNARYGHSIQLVKRPPAILRPVHITKALLTPEPGGQAYVVELELAVRGGTLDWDAFSKLPDPIFTINGKLVEDLLKFWHKHSPPNSMGASVRVPSGFFPTRTALLIVRWPFFGADWLLSFQTYDPSIVVSVSRFSSGNVVSLLFSGTNFSDKVQVYLDKSYSPGNGLTKITSDLIRVDVEQEILNAHQECFLWQPPAATLRIAIPPLQQPPAASIDTSQKPPSIITGTGSAVEYAGRSLDSITEVTLLGGPKLPFSCYSAGQGLSVFVDGHLVPAAGVRELQLKTKAGTTLRATLFVTDKA